MPLLDTHTHRSAPYREGVVSLREETPLLPGQAYSAGLHPWDTADEERATRTLEWLERIAGCPEVVALGECGVDLLRGAPLYRQLQLFRRQAEIAEKEGKALIIHCVKAWDIMLGLRRDLAPTVPWVIHGFRGKPALAAQLTDAGFYLSFGEKFNSDTIKMMPEERILAETDESPLPIHEIISRLSASASRDLLPAIAANTLRCASIGVR